MAEPRMLLEAASSYRGDLEDRRTELLATALHEHPGFCESLLAEVGVSPFGRYRIRTQQTFRLDDAAPRIDLVIWAYGEAEAPAAVVFVECKYNPSRSPRARWFDENQPLDERRALLAQPATLKKLVAIVSECDVDNERRPIPPEYVGSVLSWSDVARAADRAGDGTGWQTRARAPTAPAANRVLLEFWRYLKGDPLGGLQSDDLTVLSGIPRTEERVQQLLTQSCGPLSWADDTVWIEWETPGGQRIWYVSEPPPARSWPVRKPGGALYTLVAGAAWEDESEHGDPHLYAGCGFEADADHRERLTNSDWPEAVARADPQLEVLFDPAGAYVFASRPLRDIIVQTGSLSAQSDRIADWAKDSVARALAAPPPPPGRSRRHAPRSS